MLIIRHETPEDIDSIRCVNEQAFGSKEEGILVDKLRNRGMLTISLVAVEKDEIIGHIAYSPVVIESDSSDFEAVTLAPMSVLPLYQQKGIGGQLVRAGLEECRKIEHEIIIVVGHPEYYPRFGFMSAKSKGISCEFEVPDEAFMILELREGTLAGREGLVRFQPEFKEAM